MDEHCKIWISRTPIRTTLTLFKAFVQSALLSGLEGYVLGASDYKRLDSFMVTRLAVVLLKSEERQWLQEGRWQRMKSEKIWKTAGALPSQKELRMRRPRSPAHVVAIMGRQSRGDGVAVIIWSRSWGGDRTAVVTWW